MPVATPALCLFLLSPIGSNIITAIPNSVEVAPAVAEVAAIESSSWQRVGSLTAQAYHNPPAADWIKVSDQELAEAHSTPPQDDRAFQMASAVTMPGGLPTGDFAMGDVMRVQVNSWVDWLGPQIGIGAL